MNGYMGKILTIDLSRGEIAKQDIDEEFARKYLGGNGFAVKLIHDLVPYNVKPLSEDNVVVFATGPMTGSPVWGSGRGHLASISPQTGMFCDSNFGGNFASMLKRSGFDAVVISGKAPYPVYIFIDEGDVVIKNAEDLWGKTTGETRRLLVEKEGKGTESATIGPAGENGLVFASVICSGTRLSAAGRGGIGAVLGSKQCKAIVARGSEKAALSDGDSLKDSLKDMLTLVKGKAGPMMAMGTPFLVNIVNSKGIFGTNNNALETFEKAGAISGETIREKHQKRSVACKGCPVACGKIVAVTEGEFADHEVKMPEYETLYAIGSMLGNGDLMSIFNANAMCDEMGMDTISFGVTLAFAVECSEKGLLDRDAIERDIHFGDWESLSAIVRETALREGKLGELLSLGSAILAERIGSDSYKYLHTQQGLEIAGHSARGLRNMGLAYATSTRGGSHHDARPNYAETEKDPGFDGQPEYCIESQHNTAIGDSLVICRFVQERAFGTSLNESYLSVLRDVTGWDMDLEELRAIGERIYNLERLINVQRGADKSAAMLPHRIMEEPIPEGPLTGRYVPREELDRMLDKYYELRGWDRKGNPTEKKLSDLGLSR